MSYDFSKVSAKEIEEILPKLSRREIVELDKKNSQLLRDFIADASFRNGFF